MGRFAALVWGAAGAFVLLAAILQAGSSVSTIASGYPGKDARTILGGCVVAALAGLAALWAARRWWSARGPHWTVVTVVPAMTLFAGTIWAAILIGANAYPMWVALLASPYGVWVIERALVMGATATLLVSLLDLALGRLAR